MTILHFDIGTNRISYDLPLTPRSEVDLILHNTGTGIYQALRIDGQIYHLVLYKSTIGRPEVRLACLAALKAVRKAIWLAKQARAQRLGKVYWQPMSSFVFKAHDDQTRWAELVLELIDQGMAMDAACVEAFRRLYAEPEEGTPCDATAESAA